ncbi:MAG: type 1 glutamine amidotransferase [candidate division Zixibacteria bacterium]|nr:type 1 glutamine amidotransferase [candidate division Zixibacteria bacterium]
MSLLIIKNITHEGPGILEKIIAKRKINTKIVDLSSGDGIPEIAGYRAIVVLGGPQSAIDNSSHMNELLSFVRATIYKGIPYLGICLGMQVLAKSAGAEVFSANSKEVGWRSESGESYKVHLTGDGLNDRLFHSIFFPARIFHLHSETISCVKGISLLAEGSECVSQIIRVGKTAYGIQGHFELTKEMMLDWHEKDSDLNHISREELIVDFEKVKVEYLALGEKLFENFLTIAGF